MDDATCRSLSTLFEQETIEAAITLLTRYGIPEALYCDEEEGYGIILLKPTGKGHFNFALTIDKKH